MNWALAVAGLLSLVTLVGHLVVGGKQFMRPVLEAASLDLLVRKVMHAAFHMLSVTFAVAAAAYFAMAFGVAPLATYTAGVALTLGALFAGYAIVYFVVAVTSGVPGAVGKMFQWIIFTAVAALSVVGVRAL